MDWFLSGHTEAAIASSRTSLPLQNQHIFDVLWVSYCTVYSGLCMRVWRA